MGAPGRGARRKNEALASSCGIDRRRAARASVRALQRAPSRHGTACGAALARLSGSQTTAMSRATGGCSSAPVTGLQGAHAGKARGTRLAHPCLPQAVPPRGVRSGCSRNRLAHSWSITPPEHLPLGEGISAQANTVSCTGL